MKEGLGVNFIFQNFLLNCLLNKEIYIFIFYVSQRFNFQMMAKFPRSFKEFFWIFHNKSFSKFKRNMVFSYKKTAKIIFERKHNASIHHSFDCFRIDFEHNFA